MRVGSARTMVAMVGQIDLLYLAIWSIVDPEIGSPDQFAGSYGSSIR